MTDWLQRFLSLFRAETEEVNGMPGVKISTLSMGKYQPIREAYFPTELDFWAIMPCKNAKTPSSDSIRRLTNLWLSSMGAHSFHL